MGVGRDMKRFDGYLKLMGFVVMFRGQVEFEDENKDENVVGVEYEYEYGNEDEGEDTIVLQDEDVIVIGDEKVDENVIGSDKWFGSVGVIATWLNDGARTVIPRLTIMARIIMPWLANGARFIIP
ncbi:hypothetical protein TREMEDRAFT_65139 [Tremella mesenterica DSM 1558]|uniref:uncharacterized protein n=1 Tax=Tremella mesenterica (strain ATCC 24925 / CBS 8224 / DSM 1558 / NBRC 9311 / NRRL Y-6157 / RJB 2259-6 / UBC 559-6) TaxID=578456 RepID=UPI00032B95FF|nr:uncharacterized protein TREMEDRAFT_65139 [Tremella mesenterica DSM 1558]EIW66741.1 hypothetical protein TREMEDRAFT_65139 [Tremella mesenterica DSM 1558]